MSDIDPDARFDLEPHEYRRIVAPLRRERLSFDVIMFFMLILFLAFVLVIWPVGVMATKKVRDSIHPPVYQSRHALEPTDLDD
jgi:hypothetical protein